MSIKSNELPRSVSVQSTDAMLINTAKGTEQLPFSQASSFFAKELAPDMRSAAAEQMAAVDGYEVGVVRITNSQAYPFNSGIATVALETPRQSMNYVINVEITEAAGNVQAIEVCDKQLNGFKLRYDGSATSVTVKYYVTGGMQV